MSINVLCNIYWNKSLVWALIMYMYVWETFLFYTRPNNSGWVLWFWPHDSDRVLWFHFGHLCVRPSIRLSVECLSVHSLFAGDKSSECEWIFT